MSKVSSLTASANGKEIYNLSKKCLSIKKSKRLKKFNIAPFKERGCKQSPYITTFESNFIQLDQDKYILGMLFFLADKSCQF